MKRALLPSWKRAVKKGLSEAGLMWIAEHWDTLEAIPPRDQWKNNNGKF